MPPAQEGGIGDVLGDFGLGKAGEVTLDEEVETSAELLAEFVFTIVLGFLGGPTNLLEVAKFETFGAEEVILEITLAETEVGG